MSVQPKSQPAKQPPNNPLSTHLPYIIHIYRITDSDEIAQTNNEDNFNSFWAKYPKKTAKQAALKAWKKINPDKELFNQIISALELQKQSVQWQKDGGQFIPYPVTWLNGERWKDETETQQQIKTDKPDYSVSFSDLLKNS